MVVSSPSYEGWNPQIPIDSSSLSPISTKNLTEISSPTRNTAMPPTKTRPNSKTDQSCNGSAQSRRSIPTKPMLISGNIANTPILPFIKAKYSLDPSTLPTRAQGSCLSFETNEVMLLHSLHHTGWADATSISTAARGWIPINYFDIYKDQAIQPLLDSFLTFIASPQSAPASTSGKYTFSTQTIGNAIIAVRSLLESTDCVSRSCHTVSANPAIKTSRKALLAQLATLASIAKENAGSTSRLTIQSLLTAMFALVSKAAQFLSVYNATINPDGGEGSDRNSVSSTLLLASNLSVIYFYCYPPSAVSRMNEIGRCVILTLAYIVRTHDQQTFQDFKSSYYAGIIGSFAQDIETLNDLLMARCKDVYGFPNFILEKHGSIVVNALVKLAHTLSCSDSSISAAPELDVVAENYISVIDYLAKARTTLERFGDFTLSKSCHYRDYTQLCETDYRISKDDAELILKELVSGYYSKLPRSCITEKEQNIASKPSLDTLALYDDNIHDPVGQEYSPDSSIVYTPKDLKKYPSNRISQNSEEDNRSSSSGLSLDSIGTGSIWNERPSSYNALVNQIVLGADGDILGATIEALVYNLTTPRFNEVQTGHKEIDSFLSTFRFFSTPEELLEALIARFDSLKSVTEGTKFGIQQNVLSIIDTWMTRHWCPSADDKLCPILESFFDQDHKDYVVCQKVTALASRIIPGDKSKGQSSKLAVPPSSKASLQGSRSLRDIGNSILRDIKASTGISVGSGTVLKELCSCNEREVSRQITLTAEDLFSEITAESLLGHVLKSKGGLFKPKEVENMISFSNKLSDLVYETILSEERPKDRTNIVRFWIKVASGCSELRNFDSTMAIVNALQGTVIRRLKQTWAGVSPKALSMLAEVSRITDISNNFSTYRGVLAQCKAPSVPYLGVCLADITFLNETIRDTRQIDNTDVSSACVTNYSKYMKLLSSANKLLSLQGSYDFQCHSGVGSLVRIALDKTQAPSLSREETLYRKSCILEPRT
ncbi:hypothetical protein CANCADRAFT_1456 [Tortispora caseinolytica NRRL Y-17796]|uniref:Ras-GEF domain-containing protein n=1 Tax=Tortispora caseinolytica NRRL Y-17796 TaxID=767744 RepID=A0A1E4TM85_9ASCO|nr:hypothetical protein CANCADRAFT_1456 [Tortispora caseinolytica NRRL Y-17796]